MPPNPGHPSYAPEQKRQRQHRLGLMITGLKRKLPFDDVYEQFSHGILQRKAEEGTRRPRIGARDRLPRVGLPPDRRIYDPGGGQGSRPPGTDRPLAPATDRRRRSRGADGRSRRPAHGRVYRRRTGARSQGSGVPRRRVRRRGGGQWIGVPCGRVGSTEAVVGRRGVRRRGCRRRSARIERIVVGEGDGRGQHARFVRGMMGGVPASTGHGRDGTT